MNLGINSNNISMMSSMVGIPHKAADGAKQITKESGSSSNRIGESSEGVAEGGSGEVEEEEASSSGVKKQQTSKAQRNQQSSASRVSRKRVSDETVLDAKNKAGEAEGTKEAKKPVAPKQAQRTAGPGVLDNAKQIQHSFSKTLDETNAGSEAKQRPELQRKKGDAVL